MSAQKEFRHESEMLAPAANWLLAQGLLVKTEVPNPWGICDIVGCSLSKAAIKGRRRVGQDQPIGPRLRVELLYQLPEFGLDPISLPLLASTYQGLIDEQTIERELERLEASGFVARNSRDEWQRLYKWIPLHRRLVTVELKLNRIREVISQAIENQQLTNESYVGLPIETARRIKGERAGLDMRAAGVGLLGVGMNSCQVLLRPSTSRNLVDQVAQTHCVERFWPSLQAA